MRYTANSPKEVISSFEETISSLRRVAKGLFSYKSFYILAYNFIPLLGLILGLYDIYTAVFIFILETIILAVISIIKILYLRHPKLFIHIPLLIFIVGFFMFWLYSAIMGFYYRGQHGDLVSLLLLPYPLKNSFIVFLNLAYFAVQEFYLTFKSMRSGPLRKIKEDIVSETDPVKKEDLGGLAKVDSPILRVFASFLAIFVSIPLIIIWAFVFVFILAFLHKLNSVNLFYPVIVYPVVFAVCLTKGILDALSQNLEKQN